MLYGFTLGFSFIALGPLSNLIEQTFGDSLMLTDMTSRFDYTAIMDMVHKNGSATLISLSAILSFFVVYLFWSAFYTGGLMAVSKHKNARTSTQVFWKGGSEFFFRYLRLSIFIFLFIVAVIFIMFLFFSIDGLNPLQLKSEDFLIFRFKILLGLLVVILFFVAIVRDIAKVIIKEECHLPLITHSILKAIRKTFSLRFIFLSLLNLLFLLLVFLLYLLLKSIVSQPVLLIIFSQLFLIYRLTYRFVRLASFNYLSVAFKGVHHSDNQFSGDRV
ncbi:hypothetical protein N9L92_00675 [Saprospiraceae bacterium]|nr:hypothetical protein [Saprospiraceae bacterium]